MFLALRRLFGRSSETGQFKIGKWLGLFLFEFVVVLLGVLAAQSLQARFEESRVRQAAEVALEEYGADLQDFRDFSTYYLLSAQCQRDYVDKLSTALESTSRSPQPMEVVPPFQPNTWVTDWDNETERAVARASGLDIVQEHNRFERYSDRIAKLKAESYADWPIVEAALQASEIKAEGRLALARITGRLNELEGIATSVDRDLSGKSYQPAMDKIRMVIERMDGCDYQESR